MTTLAGKLSRLAVRVGAPLILVAALVAVSAAAARAQDATAAPKPPPAASEDDFLEIRRTKPKPAPVPAPTQTLTPGETPAEGASPGAAEGAAAVGAAEAAETPVPGGPRKVKLEDFKVNPEDYIIRPAPIDTSVALNLKKVEKEPERRWSIEIALGTGTVDMDKSFARSLLMEQFGRDVFGEVAENIGENFGWSDAGPTDPTTASRIAGNVRYRLLPTITVEGQIGHSSALTEFSQPGFRFDEKNEVLDISFGPLVTMPFRLWRFGFFAGGGLGYLRGKLTSQVFIPSFGLAPVYLVSEATGSSMQYYLRGGGEAYITRFASITIEAEYRNAKIDDLKYKDSTIESDTSALALNETDTPYVWTDYIFDFQQQQFGWLADPNQPMSMDFTGVSITAGLRYHF